jgi:hypothetical protein
MADQYFNSPRGSNNRLKSLRRDGETSLLRRNRGRTASELGGALDDGGAPTVFTSDTNPELEQDPSRGGRAPGRTLRQDLSATRGRTEVGPATDPGGGAGRVRPVAPTLSRRELEEQRRRASIDASSERMRRRQAVGSISARGPTRSQQAILAGGPTVADFLESRVNAITAASQPNAAQSEAQQRGLRRLESDRAFATNARDQNITMRGQDTEERLGLRREETLRGEIAAGERNNIRDNTRRGQGERLSVGDRITSNLWQNEESRAALAERYGTEDRGEISEIISNNVRSAAGRTDWESLPPEFQTEQGQQQLMDLYAVAHSVADSESQGLIGRIFGSSDQGLAQNFNEISDNLRDFVANGESAQLFGPSYTESGGRTFEIGGIPPEQQRVLRRMMSSARQSILNDDSPQARSLQLDMAQKELRSREDYLKDLAGASILASAAKRQSLAADAEGAPSGEAVADVALSLQAEDGIPMTRRGIRGDNYEAYRERARELIREYRDIQNMDPAEYLAQIKRQSALEEDQARMNERLGQQ